MSFYKTRVCFQTEMRLFPSPPYPQELLIENEVVPVHFSLLFTCGQH